MSLAEIPAEFHPAVKTLAREFFAEGAPAVYVACSAERVYVGLEPVKDYRDKDGTPVNVRLTAEEALSFLA